MSPWWLIVGAWTWFFAIFAVARIVTRLFPEDTPEHELRMLAVATLGFLTWPVALPVLLVWLAARHRHAQGT